MLFGRIDNMKKMYGTIKWFKNEKGYGYINGYDKETYFFDITNSINKDNFFENEEVLFIPMFDSKIPYAKGVEKQ